MVVEDQRRVHLRRLAMDHDKTTPEALPVAMAIIAVVALLLWPLLSAVNAVLQ